jgi:hypothetical protein
MYQKQKQIMKFVCKTSMIKKANCVDIHSADLADFILNFVKLLFTVAYLYWIYPRTNIDLWNLYSFYWWGMGLNLVCLTVKGKCGKAWKFVLWWTKNTKKKRRTSTTWNIKSWKSIYYLLDFTKYCFFCKYQLWTIKFTDKRGPVKSLQKIRTKI